MAKTDWQLDDIVGPDDMNEIGQEINQALSAAQTAQNTADAALPKDGSAPMTGPLQTPTIQLKKGSSIQYTHVDIEHNGQRRWAIVTEADGDLSLWDYDENGGSPRRALYIDKDTGKLHVLEHEVMHKGNINGFDGYIKQLNPSTFNAFDEITTPGIYQGVYSEPKTDEPIQTSGARRVTLKVTHYGSSNHYDLIYEDGIGRGREFHRWGDATQPWFETVTSKDGEIIRDLTVGSHSSPNAYRLRVRRSLGERGNHDGEFVIVNAPPGPSVEIRRIVDGVESGKVGIYGVGDFKIDGNTAWHTGNDTPIQKQREEAPLDWNNATTPGMYYYLETSKYTNTPPGLPGWGVLEVISTSPVNYVVQRVRSVTGGQTYERIRGSTGVWSNWDLIGGGGVKSIQKGRLGQISGGNSVDVTINSVVPENTVVIFSAIMAGGTSRELVAEVINSTTIRFRNHETAGVEGIVWQAIEYQV